MKSPIWRGICDGAYRETALIFCTAKGTPLDGVNLVRREFKPALLKTKLPEVRLNVNSMVAR
jgi:hypothetical protein